MKEVQLTSLAGQSQRCEAIGWIRLSDARRLLQNYGREAFNEPPIRRRNVALDMAGSAGLDTSVAVLFGG